MWNVCSRKKNCFTYPSAAQTIAWFQWEHNGAELHQWFLLCSDHTALCSQQGENADSSLRRKSECILFHTCKVKQRRGPTQRCYLLSEITVECFPGYFCPFFFFFLFHLFFSSKGITELKTIITNSEMTVITWTDTFLWLLRMKDVRYLKFPNISYGAAKNSRDGGLVPRISSIGSICQ
jgi:hypothetical protein